jgi:hypothetical protein
MKIEFDEDISVELTGTLNSMCMFDRLNILNFIRK